MKNLGKIALLSTSIVLSGTVAPLSLNNLSNVEAASTLKLANISYQTTANLNLRTGPGPKNKVVTTIPKSKTVTASEQTGNWFKVSYQYTSKGKKVTKIGWVSGSYLKKVAPTTVTNTTTVKFKQTTYQTTSSLNLRSGAGTKYKVLRTIPKGKAVTSTERDGTWYKVVYTYTSNGKTVKVTGWVSGTYLKEYYKTSNITGAYYFTTKTVSLYPSADTKKKALYSLAAGNGFYITSKVINSIGETWYKVSFNGKTLYLNSKDVYLVSVQSLEAANYQSNKETYLYTSVGKAFSKVAQIPNGTVISTSKQIGDWFAVNFNGKSGFVYSKDFTKYSLPSEEKLDEAGDYLALTDVVLRVKPDDASDLLSSIPKGAKLSLIAKTSNGWYKVTYNGMTGYILGNYIQKAEDLPPAKEEPSEVPIAKATYMVLAGLNLRESNDTVSKSLGVIPKGTIVVPASKTSDDWYKVSYDEKTGYVYGKYLQQVITGDPMENRDGYQFIDLRTQSTVVPSQIDNYIASYEKNTGMTSILHGKGKVFIDTGKKYGVNALYLAAHAIHESAFGTSPISIAKNNLFGFGAYDAAPYMSAYRFANVDLCIDYIAREIKATYLNPSNWKYNGAYLGFSTKTLSNTRIDEASKGMNFYYASDPNWGKAVAQHMENILHYDKTFYTKASVDTSFPTRPAVPAGSDIFPANIFAVANSNLVLDSKKGMNDAVKTITKGTSFNVLEKTNDYWLKVMVDGEEYWTNDVKFSSYTDYLSVQNLGRVTAVKLNVRPDASTNNTPIASLSLNDFVQIVLKKDGTLSMDSSKGWYQVVLASGTTGWVSASYLYTKDFK
ncbi:SH3 domain-containing protein [Bacillus salipaludis]|uniref:SH3 domain-containing protein n=1 Tax=Bacillus salipaludis TaxID=2547811 RepID=A0AA90R2W3_9BACI|nr:SH3 domain-containing protein [Bacillus salipaludis]MDQ6600367.1 SH3 domain-containing protein [Bacillus salipaludis]